MTRGWQEDKDWSDQFIPEIKKILGLHLITVAPIEEDQKRNTDLITLNLGAIRVGCRVRHVYGETGINYLERYGGEFTIRLKRPTGQPTELSKIMAGWGDYFFYGFGEDKKLHKWTLSIYDVFRRWYSMQLDKGNNPGIRKSNADGSSDLIAFRFAVFPDDFIYAESITRQPEIIDEYLLSQEIARLER